MDIISLNPSENKNLLIHKSLVSGFNKHSEKKGEIKQGMTPAEIADIVSDRLIDIISEQFEQTKREFHESKKTK